MAFKKTKKALGGFELETLHKKGCEVCPLALIRENRHPNMKPDGTKKPLVYMLGEAPGKNEDQRGIPFVGAAGQVLHFRIPKEWQRDLRWNNCVRTRPPGNRTPTIMEIECCRPSVVRDIEESKPEAIFGFGNTPLYWLLGQTGITRWRGRRVPVRVGKHTCWYYPMLHPSYVSRSRIFVPRTPAKYGSSEEFAFALDLKRAFKEVDQGLPKPIVHTNEDVHAGVEIVTGANGTADLKRVLEFVKSIWNEPEVGIDYETNRLRPYAKSAKILSVALSNGERTMAWAINHREAEWTDEQYEQIENILENFLHNAPCVKVAFNLSFEQEWSAYFYGKACIRGSKWHDAQSQAYVLDERHGISLERQCIQHFGVSIKTFSKAELKKLDKQPLRKVLEYNGPDAKYALLLYHKQAPMITKRKLDAVLDHQMERIPTVVLSQLKGIPVNLSVVRENSKKYEKRIEEIEDKIDADPDIIEFEKRKGHFFRPSATRDVSYLFREMLGYSIENCQAATIETLDHPVADLMIAWKKAQKLKSTYIDPLLPEHPKTVYYDGYMHPSYNLTATVTWRTSASGPNIQNQPKRQKEAKADIRRQVSPGGNLRVVSFDYGQIQARNVGMESLDKELIKAFWDRYDVHTDWCERIAQLYPQWIEEGARKLATDKALFKGYRDRAKNEFVFPSFFGAQSKAVSEYLGIPLVIADQIHEEFWDRFGGIRKWHERVKDDYYRTGYVTGLSGFRRRAPVSPNEMINAPIQGDEAIIVIDAMIRLSKLCDPRFNRAIKTYDDRFQAEIEIHDDLSFIWPKHEIEKNAEIVIEHMVNVPFEWAHCVPIVVEMSVGESWEKQEAIGDFSSDLWKGKLLVDQKKKLEPFLGSWADGTGWASHRDDELMDAEAEADSDGGFHSDLSKAPWED